MPAAYTCSYLHTYGNTYMFNTAHILVHVAHCTNVYQCMQTWSSFTIRVCTCTVHACLCTILLSQGLTQLGLLTFIGDKLVQVIKVWMFSFTLLLIGNLCSAVCLACPTRTPKSSWYYSHCVGFCNCLRLH